jgi:hypothetical protein
MVWIERGSERVVGVTTEEIRVIEVDGRQALQRTQAAESPSLGNRTASAVVLRSTFGPLSHHDQHGEGSTSLHYSGLAISGRRTGTDGKVEPIHVTLDSPVFDAHSVEMILRVLPLRQSYVAELPVYHAHFGQVLKVALRVQGKEAVDAGGGRMADAWVVETDWGQARVTYWIGQKSPELLKQSLVLPTGALLQFVR